MINKKNNNLIFKLFCIMALTEFALLFLFGQLDNINIFFFPYVYILLFIYNIITSMAYEKHYRAKKVKKESIRKKIELEEKFFERYPNLRPESW